MAKQNLTNALNNRKDEFYTQLVDIEKELMYYKSQFKDKVVFCNCDDPFESNFFKYFAMNFNHLGLKKLITTSYSGSPIVTEQLSLFDIENIVIKKEKERNPYKLEITEVNDYNEDGAVDLTDVEWLIKNRKNTLSLLKGDGDFRSKECIDLLKEADIVVTNPPFSLFREYVAQLIEYDKKFLIIGNQNAITYQEIFPLIKKNKLWLGKSMNGSNRYFRVPDSYPLTEKTGKIIDGIKFAFVKSVVWYTNLKLDKEQDKIILFKKYNTDEFPTYDNYNAINVDRVQNIPIDYTGVIGVPITFMHKYNHKQFKILGMTKTPICHNNDKKAIRTKTYDKVVQHGRNGETSSGNKVNDGPVIIVNEKPSKTTYYTIENLNGYLIAPYARILIERIDMEENNDN